MLEYIKIDIQSELMLIKQINQKSKIFVIVGIFQINVLKYELYLCNGCYDLMQKAVKFNDVAIVSIKGTDYRIHLCAHEQELCNKHNEKF